MTTIKSYKEVENSEGEKFFMLILVGEIEPIKSKDTGKWYLTARKAGIPSTFDQETCEQLLGKKMPGSIQRVPCEPYEFVTDSGQTLILEHTYVYNPEPVTTEDHVFESREEGVAV